MLIWAACGVAGMALGTRGKSVEVQRARWGKTASYFAIVALLILFALRAGPTLVAVGLIIVVGGALEIGRAARANRPVDSSFLSYRVLAGAVYCALALGFLGFLAISRPPEIVSAFFTVFCFDAFSQVSGQLFGKHQLSPKVSPNKTVEGLLGGLIAAMAAGWIASTWSSTSYWPVRTALIAVSSLTGDLAASHFKRRHGIKDFSNWIPYQGGFLDRFDSLIAAGSAAYLFALLCG